jgi:prevent-host-death family protein
LETIRPSSILRDYNKVIDEVQEGEPIVLTKNGVGKVVMVNIEEWQRQKAEIWLLNELNQADQEFNNDEGKDISEFVKQFKLGEFREKL